MAISTDTVVDFFGTQDVLTTNSTSLGSSAFATTASVVNWTNDDNAPEAGMVFRGVWATAPAAGGSVPVYARHIAVSTAAEDMTQPTTTFKYHLVAIFPVDTSTAVQVLTERLYLPNLEDSQVYQFFAENQTSQALSSDYTLNITPLTKGPNPA